MELVLSCVQLSQNSVEELVNKIHGGVLTFEGQGYGVSTNTLAQVSGQVTLPVSQAYTNAQKVDFVMTPKTTQNGTSLSRPHNDVKSVFVKNYLTSYGLLSNGQLVEATRSCRASDAEALAMSLIELNMLDDIEQAGLVYKDQAELSVDHLENTGTEAGAGAVGSFVGSLSLCSFKNGNEKKLCSGRNFVNATNSLQLDFTPASGNDQTVTIDIITYYVL